MDVITMATDAYIAQMQKIDSIADAVSKKTYQPLSEQWLDVSEACLALKISKRTLQSYRDNKVLPYSQISGKIYFKVADIQALLEKNYNTK
ncbi:MAG: helix-turn-helix domain-containing protein [Bacteroidales bacterium]|nr:helix-turn-helix domain-containing protein [Bacteroidales bacterium]